MPFHFAIELQFEGLDTYAKKKRIHISNKNKMPIIIRSLFDTK